MNNRKINVFIAGHNGLVGRALRKKLDTFNDYKIITAERSNLDLINQFEVNNFLKNNVVDVIIIAAARVGGIYANSNFPAEFIYENIMIQSNLIHGAYKNNIKDLLFLGSSCIYPKENFYPINEEALLTGTLEKTNEPYAIAKIAGIKMCEYYNKQYSTNYKSVMPTNLYGEGDNFDELQGHVIPSLISKFNRAIKQNNSDVIVWGTGKPLREFMHVDDMADACIHILKLSEEYYKNYSFVNVGTGNEISIKELAALISKISGFKGKIIFDNSKPDGTMRKLLDVSLLNKLGWKSKISLEAGLIRTYNWYKENYG